MKNKGNLLKNVFSIFLVITVISCSKKATNIYHNPITYAL